MGEFISQAHVEEGNMVIASVGEGSDNLPLLLCYKAAEFGLTNRCSVCETV